MSIKLSNQAILEPSQKLDVMMEAEVIVIGGGPAGIGSAISAARNGMDTVLVERYGHLGGLATGGLVILIMPMSDEYGKQCIAGICQELIERLDAVDGVVYPDKAELGSADEKVIGKWQSYPFFIVDGRLRYSALFDPELMKCVLNDMVQESGIKLLLHSWGCRALVEDRCMKGIVFESKSGRKAILGKVVIDTTGDGDIFASAGADYDDRLDPNLRSSTHALVFRLGNVDVDAYLEFRKSEPERWGNIIQKLSRIDSFRLMPILSWRKDMVWVNNWVPGYSGVNVEDLTSIEIKIRKAMPIVHDMLKREVPGFENSFILDTAPQVGIRVSRRLQGEYVLTENDLRTGKAFRDTIAVCPAHWGRPPSAPNVNIPYRSLLPSRIEGLLTAGRCFSSDPVANDLLAPIQFCIAMGEAAGAGAALAVKTDVQPRDVNIQSLQQHLRNQNVPLPD